MSEFRARAEHDQFMRGVNVYLGTDHYALSFPHTERVVIEERAVETVVRPLFLPNDAARALYEALADHYGHAGHDIRALRKDYDAERKRVDQFISALLEKK